MADNTINQPFLFVALDGLAENRRKTLEFAQQLLRGTTQRNFGFKLNLDFLLRQGVVRAVREIRCAFPGRQIFADLKMWNGKRTMRSIAKTLIDNEVDYLNVYALADDLLSEVVRVAEGSKTKVLGLTVLTHYTEDYCQKHFRRSLRETVQHFAKVVLDAVGDGIILPGTTLEVVQDLKTIKAVPGIRSEWYTDTRHEQEITAKEAVSGGADILVCGSPIMKSSDPVRALIRVLSEMEAGLKLTGQN